MLVLLIVISKVVERLYATSKVGNDNIGKSGVF